MYVSFITISILLKIYCSTASSIPLVINTWPFAEANKKAWEELTNGGSNIDALVAGCSKCEELQCDGTVGYGGSPTEDGETTLDALIFDGSTMDMGAVGSLRRVKNVISVARHVLENTQHSFLVGDLATHFAREMGFSEESLSTNKSTEIWVKWIENQCQPNFWKSVEPDPRRFCGPYKPMSENSVYYEEYKRKEFNFDSKNHDTIGMIVIDSNRNIVAGTSTNGATHKIPGRVGDSPIPGAGAYADNSIGAAVATGDGDIMMRFLPSFLAVEEMRRGETPNAAAKTAISRILSKYSNFFGAVIAVNSKGEYGAACSGMDYFPFSVANEEVGNETVIKQIAC